MWLPVWCFKTPYKSLENSRRFPTFDRGFHKKDGKAPYSYELPMYIFKLCVCVCWEPYPSWAPATAGGGIRWWGNFRFQFTCRAWRARFVRRTVHGDRTQRWQTTDVDLTPLDSDELQSLAGLLVVYILIFALWEKCMIISASLSCTVNVDGFLPFYWKPASGFVLPGCRSRRSQARWLANFLWWESWRKEHWLQFTLQGTNISHLGKGKSSSKCHFWWIC